MTTASMHVLNWKGKIYNLLENISCVALYVELAIDIMTVEATTSNANKMCEGKQRIQPIECEINYSKFGREMKKVAQNVRANDRTITSAHTHSKLNKSKICISVIENR